MNVAEEAVLRNIRNRLRVALDELSACQAANQTLVRQVAVLKQRPTRAEHEKLQAELEQTTKAYEAELRRITARNGRR